MTKVGSMVCIVGSFQVNVTVSLLTEGEVLNVGEGTNGEARTSKETVICKGGNGKTFAFPFVPATLQQ